MLSDIVKKNEMVKKLGRMQGYKYNFIEDMYFEQYIEQNNILLGEVSVNCVK